MTGSSFGKPAESRSAIPMGMTSLCSRIRDLRLILVTLSVFAVCACGAPTPTVPAVVGLQLDEAHNVLADAGYRTFDDIDALDERAPLWDANWAVVRQEPPAGSALNYEDTVRLDVMKKDDSEIVTQLPEDSPVLSEIWQQQLEAEQRRNGVEDERRRADEQTARNPLSCAPPRVSVTYEAAESTIVVDPPGDIATWATRTLVVQVTNESLHKIATTGVWVTLESVVPASQEDSGTSKPYATSAHVPDPITDHPWHEYVTIDPGRTHNFEVDLPFFTLGTTGQHPVASARLNGWHFHNAEIDRHCLQMNPDLHE